MRVRDKDLGGSGIERHCGIYCLSHNAAKLLVLPPFQICLHIPGADASYSLHVRRDIDLTRSVTGHPLTIALTWSRESLRTPFVARRNEPGIRFVRARRPLAITRPRLL